MSKNFLKVVQSEDVNEVLKKAENALLLGFKIEINVYKNLYSMTIYSK